MIPLPDRRVVSAQEMERWPMDRARSGEKRWAETTWGSGPTDGPRRLLYNWNTWPCRVVFEVASAALAARGQIEWRRSQLSIRMKGLKLVSAKSGTEIKDARVTRFDQAAVGVEFHPVDGPGLYHLYYGAFEDACFAPTEDWLRSTTAAGAEIVAARAVGIEARCAIDGFDAMEIVALPDEVEALRARHASSPYLLFPEDRDRPIKLQFELPVSWAQDGPRGELTLSADRHEYRVFQLGIWAAQANVVIDASGVTSSDLATPQGQVIPGARVQCLTLQSRIQSRYIARPRECMHVPTGQVRALWFGIDIPRGAAAGEYRGTVTIAPQGLPARSVPIHLRVSETIVPERGDHDLHRLARLRWLESDVGLSDKVFAPFKALRVSNGGRTIRSWGHRIDLGPWGLPKAVSVGEHQVTQGAMALAGRVSGKPLAWRNPKFTVTRKAPGFVEWTGCAQSHGLEARLEGRIEYDACAVITLSLHAMGERPLRVKDLTLTLPWAAEHAWLASGLGYQGKRDGDRCWRSAPRLAKCFEPAVWMGSVEAGLAWKTWVEDRYAATAGMASAASSMAKSQAWEDAARPDAITVRQENGAVVMQANLGEHTLTPGSPWQIRFAMIPTPVKPPDARHWQFRYMHKGGGFWPGEHDTPQSFLKDQGKRLEEAALELGVKRLNLHDWWGPAFNYAWQWDGPDNLARLTREAHQRGVRVKVYNSGRELSSFAPEFWPIVYEGAGYEFRDAIDPAPRLWFQDAWRQNHLPDGLPAGWPRLHDDRGNEHCIPVSNATRNGNFYLESMRYMTRFFGTDGAYWDGADGPSLGHREMAKRLFVIFKQTNPHATIDVHHGHALTSSPIADHILVFPFIDSLWHGEGFEAVAHDPYAWLVEIAALPFGVPSEMLGMDDMVGKGMLFGIWSRHGWYQETEVPRKLWRFFDRYRIAQATMRGWWERGGNGVTVDRPETLVTAYTHKAAGNRKKGVLLAIATWHPPLAAWMEMTLDVTLLLDRKKLGLPAGKLTATDVITDETIDIDKPVPLPNAKWGRLVWVR